MKCTKWQISTGRREHKKEVIQGQKKKKNAGRLLQNYFPSVNGRDLLGRLPTSADRCFLIDW